MGRKCSVCIRTDRALIDEATLSPSASIREVAERFGLSYSAMARHCENHLPQLMSKALEDRKAKGEHELFDEHPPTPPAIKEHEEHELELGGKLLDKVLDLETKTKEILTDAMNTKSLKTALMAIGRAADLIELQGKLVGKLKEAAVNVHNNLIYLTSQQLEEEWSKQAPQ